MRTLGTRRSRLGQATVEAALVVPILAMLALGTYDLSRAFSLSAQAESAARSGIRTAISDPGADIAHAIYYEPTNLNSGSSTLDWGDTDPCVPVAGVCTGGDVQSQCTGNVSGNRYRCGDPAGCYAAGTPGEGFWTANPTSNACYATRLVRCTTGLYSCQVVDPSLCGASPQCLQFESWTDPPCRRQFTCQRPGFMTCPCVDNQTPYTGGSAYIGIEVVVTFRFQSETSLIGKFFRSSNGYLFIRHFAVGYPIYAPANCCADSTASFTSLTP